MSCHLAMSFSWMELNWSGAAVIGLPGSFFISSSHFHWMTEASSSVVGVSALYSSSLGA